MIAVRPSIFCFFGKLAPDLYASVPVAIRRRLGVVPDVFSFLSVTEESIDLKLGSKRSKLPSFEGNLQNQLWQTLTYASAAIGNIRVRTDALRRPAEVDTCFQVVRGGPDIYLVECLSDTLGWEIVFAIAEKIHNRNEAPPAAGRARGIFPLFHLPSTDEDMERDQALKGLRRLEGLVQRGVLFPSIILDRVNRNGHPLERWEDLTELLSDFLALGSASEASADIWRTFPQVADLHGRGSEEEGIVGLSSMGLSRFRFSKDALADELSRLLKRDLKRALSRTFTAKPVAPDGTDCGAFLDLLLQMKASLETDGQKRIENHIVEWISSLDVARTPSLGGWATALDRVQLALFERLGEAAQRIENIRQENEALSLETPMRDSWIARVSVLLPVYMPFLPTILGGALAGSFLGFLLSGLNLAGYLSGFGIGALLGFALGWFIRLRWSRETFTLGEFPEGSFTAGFPVPRALEHYSRREKMRRITSGISIQLWGELRNQVEPEEKERLDSLKASLAADLETAKEEESGLVFLDRCVNSLRESVESWRLQLAEVESWEARRGFSGDVFPADGSRKIYDWMGGRSAVEALVPGLLNRISPLPGALTPTEMAEESAAAWGREKAQMLDVDKVLEIFDDHPEDLLERLSEASAPLWARPGDRDELLRCFGADFLKYSRENDLRHSVNDEAVFIRVLGGIRSAELART